MRGASCAHDLESLIRQRVYAIALGHEDLNDHGELRSDLALRTALHRDETLASPDAVPAGEPGGPGNGGGATKCWWSASSPRSRARRGVWFWTSTRRTTARTALRRGASSRSLLRPLLLPAAVRVLRGLLARSAAEQVDGAKHSWAVLALLVRRLRRVARGSDHGARRSGFCRWRMLRWFDRHGVDYVIGVAWRDRRRRGRWRIGKPATSSACFFHGARLKAEHGARGGNPRFVVTSLGGDPLRPRLLGEPPSWICSPTARMRQVVNQFRLLLSSLALAGDRWRARSVASRPAHQGAASAPSASVPSTAIRRKLARELPNNGASSRNNLLKLNPGHVASRPILRITAITY